jgi:hypothetical protein
MMKAMRLYESKHPDEQVWMTTTTKNLSKTIASKLVTSSVKRMCVFIDVDVEASFDYDSLAKQVDGLNAQFVFVYSKSLIPPTVNASIVRWVPDQPLLYIDADIQRQLSFEFGSSFMDELVYPSIKYLTNATNYAYAKSRNFAKYAFLFDPTLDLNSVLKSPNDVSVLQDCLFGTAVDIHEPFIFKKRMELSTKQPISILCIMKNVHANLFRKTLTENKYVRESFVVATSTDRGIFDQEKNAHGKGKHFVYLCGVEECKELITFCTRCIIVLDKHARKDNVKTLLLRQCLKAKGLSDILCGVFFG